MVKYKELITTSLEVLKNNYKISKKEDINYQLFSGIKPSSYYVPNILEYRNYFPYSNKEESISLSWFVEIWINNICIWRKSKSNKDNSDLKQYEDELMKCIFDEILLYGLSNCFRHTLKRTKNKAF